MARGAERRRSQLAAEALRSPDRVRHRTPRRALPPLPPTRCRPGTVASGPRIAPRVQDPAPILVTGHYGGAFRQVLDATSERRGNLIEDAVEALFVDHGVPFIRTGSHNQAEIAQRFEVTVTPAPDFVVFDAADRLQAMLECKGANDGGTARDKALRFKALRAESLRLGGVPLLAVLAGLGWARVNDTLGPVVRDCDGRVFTLATLPEMLSVAPFSSLEGLSVANPG